MSESFIYLWYDAPNKKYYLGKHKGSPDDTYTHSSTIWESFTKDNIPEGVTRRILAYGTEEEMCILEHKLLVNRKNRCWDRYYNESLGDPRYVDMSGENNPNYIDGRLTGWRNDKSLRVPWAKDNYNKNKDKVLKRQKEYRENSETRPIRLAVQKRHRDKKKAEAQGEGTLDKFLK